MPITFYRHPLLLLEAEELVSAFVNQTPVQSLARDTPGCVQTADVENMMRTACAGIDPQDETVQFFFRQYDLPHCADQAVTCVARLLVFSFADWSPADVDSAIAAFRNAWSWEEMSRSRLVFAELMPYGISVCPCGDGDPVPFTNGLNQLDIPRPLKDALIDVFSDFPRWAARLTDLLRPVMEVLSKALSPFILSAEPQICSWEDQVREQSPADFVREYMHLETSAPINRVVAAPLLLVRTQFIAHLDGDCFCVLVGINGEPLLVGASEFGNWAYQALRLLGNPVRMRMLEALHQQPMTAQELTDALELPYLSAVIRDLGSMLKQHLLELKYIGTRRQYGVNYNTLRILIRKLRSLCPDDDAGLR